jgi:hypothetical protein
MNNMIYVLIISILIIVLLLLFKVVNNGKNLSVNQSVDDPLRSTRYIEEFSIKSMGSSAKHFIRVMLILLMVFMILLTIFFVFIPIIGWALIPVNIVIMIIGFTIIRRL